MIGAIEAGGTKFCCALASDRNTILTSASFPTTSPTETLNRVRSFFQEAQLKHGTLQSLGLACFGPVGLDSNSHDFGHILNTPKSGWAHYPIVEALRTSLGVPVAFDTDVNGAALGEFHCGAGRGHSSLVYITVGTGIGGGAIIDGKILHGLIHPEMGHMQVPRHPDDNYRGHCPSHGDCLEGLACGPALGDRWNMAAEALTVDHPAWDIQADYLSSMCINLTAVLSPETIILGGGVMQYPGLLDKTRTRFLERFNDYLPLHQRLGSLDNYIQSPELSNQAGTVGALLLAESVRPESVSR